MITQNKTEITTDNQMIKQRRKQFKKLVKERVLRIYLAEMIKKPIYSMYLKV